ncbi:MAG: 4Fe-4S binding protein [Candidatus Methanoplasma sp.]|jgi:formate hydrogenlyase subunit 6/NADH:ubiquinone oxidoreductase subunit I|nr:4Fe-4S binding protein [Candidatus Methanoplasma sp.]
MGTFRISGLVLRSLFKRPSTTKHPKVAREWEDGTRGRVLIDAPSCILCGICAKRCPSDALAVDRAGATWEINRMRCVQCSHCVEVCPKKCLIMDKQYTSSSMSEVIETAEIQKADKEREEKTPE